jgi:hypothetical protein
MPGCGYLACLTCMVHCRNPASFHFFFIINYLLCLTEYAAIGQPGHTHHISAAFISRGLISRTYSGRTAQDESTGGW